VVTSKPDLQLLSSVFVLLWPPQIVFFGDFAVLDNALDLGDEEGADRHLFANERVIAVVGIVGVSCDRASTVTNDSEVKF